MPEHNQRQLSKHEKKLKEENQALRSEVNDLKAQISRLADKIEGGKWPPAAPEGFLSPEKKKSVQYLSDEYDDLMAAKSQTMDELRLVSTRLEAIEKKCQEMTAAIETFEDYSYKNNLKIVGSCRKRNCRADSPTVPTPFLCSRSQRYLDIRHRHCSSSPRKTSIEQAQRHYL